jgi:hypothetical protein
MSSLAQPEMARQEEPEGFVTQRAAGALHLASKVKTNPTEPTPQRVIAPPLACVRGTVALSEFLKLATDSFCASKTRFALTALGMVIGTASVILVVTIGLTGKQYILEEIQKIGTNSVELEYSAGGATAAEQVLYNDFLTRDDEKAVDAQVPGVMYSSPVLEMHTRISFGGGTTKDTLVRASTLNTATSVTCLCSRAASSIRKTIALTSNVPPLPSFSLVRGMAAMIQHSAEHSTSAAFHSLSSASSKRAWMISGNRRSPTRLC